MTATQLDTVPASLDVTTATIDTWAIDFAAALQTGESIASAAASLLSASSVPGIPVVGFVTGATIGTTKINVAWTGSVLSQGSEYVLHTVATLNTGAKIVLLTRVVCIG